MKRPTLILICLLLQACSATTKELGNSLWDSLFGTPGVQLTDDDIQNMPYASQYMQLNGGPQLFVVLPSLKTDNKNGSLRIKPLSSHNMVVW